MSRAPVFDFTFNGKKLADLGIAHLIQEVEFTESLDKFDVVKMIVNDGPGLELATDLVKLGSVMQLSMGYVNEGIYPMTIVFLQAYEPDFANQQIIFTFMSYLKGMDVTERDRALIGRTVREVVQEIVSEYAVLEVGQIDNGELMLSDTTTQSKQTDLSVLEGIASKFGMKWKVEPSSVPGIWLLSLYKLEYDKSKADGLLPLHAYPKKEYQDQTKSLKLKSFRPKSNILGVSSSVEIRSNNPNQPIEVVSNPKDASIEPSVVRGSEIVATVFGQVTRVHFMENVTDEEAAQVIAEQLQQENELAFVTAPESQLNEGIPNLRVGDVRRVVPRGIRMFEKVFTGEYLVTGTRHKVSALSGYDTWLTMSMNCLRVPPPPEPSFGGGGGGGTPVLIKVYPPEWASRQRRPDLGPVLASYSSAEGWYIYFNSEGYPVLGQPITQAEIEANDYWMSHIVARTAFFTIQSTAQAAAGDALSSPLPMGLTAIGQIAAAYGSGPSSQSHASGAYSRDSVSTIRIDWPLEYNRNFQELASPLISPLESMGEAILEGIDDRFADGVAERNLAAAQEAEYAAQQARADQLFSGRPGFAALQGVNTSMELLNMFGN